MDRLSRIAIFCIPVALGAEAAIERVCRRLPLQAVNFGVSSAVIGFLELISMLRSIAFVGLPLMLTAPSFAQDMTTVQAVLTNGVVIHDTMAGLPVDIGVTYHSDGTSALHIVGPRGNGRDISGTWRLDGEKVCSTNQLNPIESCVAIPPDKKPGDSFVVATPRGDITLTINR